MTEEATTVLTFTHSVKLSEWVYNRSTGEIAD